jgi:hypothetical protein
LRLFGSRSRRRIRAWPGRLADRDTAITAMVMAAAVMAVA